MKYLISFIFSITIFIFNSCYIPTDVEEMRMQEPLASPRNIRVTSISETSLRLDWTGPDTCLYKIERSFSQGINKNFTTLDTLVIHHNFIDSTLHKDSICTYQITAYTKYLTSFSSQLIVSYKSSNILLKTLRPAHFVSQIEYTLDGKGLVSSGYDSIMVWETSNWDLISPTSSNPIYGGIFSLNPNGKDIAIANGQNIALRHILDGQLIRKITIDSSAGLVGGIAFSPDGSMLASSTFNKGIIHLWKVLDGSLIRTLDTAGIVYNLSFSPNGNNLVSTNYGNIKTFQLNDGTLLRTNSFSGKGKAIFNDAKFSPDGTKFVAIGNYMIYLNANDWSETYLPLWTGGVCFSFSPDSKFIIEGYVDNRLLLFDVINNKLIQTLLNNDARIISVAYNPNGNQFAGADETGRINIWSTEKKYQWSYGQ